MGHQVKSIEVLKYIRKHPGLPVSRLSVAFGKCGGSLYNTVKKLEKMGKVRAEEAHPDFLRKKARIYFAKRS